MNMKKYLAEMIGTMVLVVLGCGVAIATGCEGNAGIVATALAFGLVIVAMAFSIGNVSGCHINPAVSLAMLILKKISLKDFLGYIVAQLVGALLGCLVLMVFFGAKCGFGANAIQPAIQTPVYETAMGQEVQTDLVVDFAAMMKALVAEIVLTFVFVFTIIGVTSKNENKTVSGIVIGLALVLVHLLGIRLTGTSVNPARSLMPALFACTSSTEPLKEVWIFILGPLAGGALAAVCYKALDSNKADAE